MRVRCRVRLFAPRLEKASSMVHDMEQWSMMALSQPAIPIPSSPLADASSVITPSLISLCPSRIRIKRVIPSLVIPKGQSRCMTPLPGAVCPAMVTYWSPHIRRFFRAITPPTSNTMVRGPDSFFIPYRNDPSIGFSSSPLSSSVVT